MAFFYKYEYTNKRKNIHPCRVTRHFRKWKSRCTCLLTKLPLDVRHDISIGSRLSATVLTVSTADCAQNLLPCCKVVLQK